MKIGTPKEIYNDENRVAITPDSARQLHKLGYGYIVQKDAGSASGFSNELYREAGVEIVDSAAALFKAADIVIKVRPL